MNKRSSTNRSVSKRYHKAFLRAFVLLLVGGVIYAFIGGDFGLIRMIHLEKEQHRLNTTIAQLKMTQKKYLEQEHLLQTDREYIARYAREHFGLIEDGEIVYRFVSSDD